MSIRRRTLWVIERALWIIVSVWSVIAVLVFAAQSRGAARQRHLGSADVWYPYSVEVWKPPFDVDGDQLSRVIRYAIERKQVEKALKASERRYRSMIEQNADGMIVVSLDGRVRFVNPSAEALYGRPAWELQREGFEPPGDLDAETELLIARRDPNTGDSIEPVVA